MRNLALPIIASILFIFPFVLADEFVGPGGCTDPISCKEYCSAEGKYEECRRYFESGQGQSRPTSNFGGPGSGGFEGKSGPAYDGAKPDFQNGPGGCKGERECMEYCSKPNHYEECSQFAKRNGFYSSNLRPAEYHYEDIDPEMMIAGKMFEGADINPKDFIQYCPDAEAMVDAAISKLKEQGKWDIDVACGDLEENLAMCEDQSSHCKEMQDHPAFISSSKVGQITRTSSSGDGGFKSDYYSDFTDEEIITCDELSEEALYEACLDRHEEFRQQRDVGAECERQWEEQQKYNSQYCESFEGKCDKDAFVEQEKERQREYCRNAYSAEEPEYDKRVEECVDSRNYDEAWSFQEQNCRSQNDMCDRDGFVSQCKERFESSLDQEDSYSQADCRRQASEMYPKIAEGCEQRDYYYEQCLERSSQSCSFMRKAVDSCNSVTEESLRGAMVDQASRFCKFKDFEGEEVHLRGHDVSMLVKHLQEARDAAPEEYKPLIEAGAEDIVDTAENVTEIEGRGIGYKLRWFVGAAAENEKRDAAQLRQSAEKLQSTIDALRLVLEELEDETLKATISDQIEELEGRVAELEDLADSKEKRAKGWLSFLFGGDDSGETESN